MGLSVYFAHYSSLGSTIAYTSLQYTAMLNLKNTNFRTPQFLHTVDLVKSTVRTSVSHGQSSASAVEQLTVLFVLFVLVPRQTNCLFVHTGGLEHLPP